ncbi:MAG: cobalamin-dependent protein [Gemmatimonadales bacterium]
MNSRVTSLHKHPMRLVIRESGLSADVLRAWEKRYQAVTPARSAGGQRLYSDDDLVRLSLLQQLTTSGRNISQVARLSAAELRTMLASSTGQRSTQSTETEIDDAGVESLLTRLHAATAVLDDQTLERLLWPVALRLGAVAAIERVVAPFLREIGARWHRQDLNPAHEHLATAVVQRALYRLREGTTPPEDAPRIVVASLQGERHELGLQIVAAVAASEAWRVIFLGADLPTQSIAEATIGAKARVLAISIVSGARNTPVVAELTALHRTLSPGVSLVVGGAGAAQYLEELEPLGIHVLSNLAQLRALLHTFHAPIR